MFYYLLIVNKNGSLIFDKSFTDKIKLSSNEAIKMASIFYSMHAISAKLTPVKTKFNLRIIWKKVQNWT
jgi:hypothetical protein